MSDEGEIRRGEVRTREGRREGNKGMGGKGEKRGREDVKVCRKREKREDGRRRKQKGKRFDATEYISDRMRRRQA